MDPPTLVRERVAVLLGALYNSDPAGRKRTVAEIVHIFRRHPSLMSEDFAFRTGSYLHRIPTPITPLGHFLAASVDDVGAIRMLCHQLSPARRNRFFQTPCGKWGGLPIHEACWHSSAAVFDFLLAQQKPELLAVQDNLGQYPLSIAMSNRKLPVAILKRMLDMFPGAIVEGCSSMLQDWPLEFLESLVHAWPETETHLVFKDCGGRPFNLAQTKILCQLFPKIKTLSLSTMGWDVPAFGYLLNELTNNASIEHIQYLTLPSIAREESQQQQTLLDAFRKLIEGNSCIKHLQELVCEDSDVTIIQLWLRSIDMGICNNRTLDEFHFTSLNGKIYLKNEGLLDAFKGHQLGLSLHILEDDDHDCLASMVPQISAFASFRAVLLQYSSSVPKDITNHIVTLLNQGHSFKFLGCYGGYKVDLIAVCEALRSNSTLLGFETYNRRATTQELPPDAISAWRSLLEEHNMTLMQCLLLETEDPKIQHFLDLNRLGRSIMRNGTAEEGEKLVEILLKVWQDDGLKDPHNLRDSRVQSLLYGLLGEAPGSWCHSTCEKKRKKSELSHFA